jgi:hypothetical protein
MLLAVISPASYSSHFVSGSLYLLVTALAVGYVIVLLVIEVLDRYSVEPEGANARVGSGMIGLIARNRWFWIPPLYILALLLILIVTHTRGADAAQFMYRSF